MAGTPMWRLYGAAIRSAVGVVAAGAVLGYWMFGLPGLVLFAGVGATCVLTLAFAGSRTPRLAPALALALAAAALESASTLGWGGADAPDGTRYKASPVGLSHVLTPREPVSRTIDCGWWAASGYRAACAVAPGGGAAFAVLRLVYPLLLTGVALCAGGALMSLGGGVRWVRAQRLLGAVAALAAALAVMLFAASLGKPFAPLAGLPVGVGGTLGTMQLTAAVLLCLSVSLSRRPWAASSTPQPAFS